MPAKEDYSLEEDCHNALAMLGECRQYVKRMLAMVPQLEYHVVMDGCLESLRDEIYHLGKDVLGLDLPPMNFPKPKKRSSKRGQKS